MPTKTISHFVFVDFENVPDIDLGPLDGHRAIVTLFLGKKSKLKAELVEQITRLSFEVRLIKVGVTQKNALDFVLAFHLGRTASGHPGSQFHIVSCDKKDFEPLVRQLQADHVRVERANSIAELPFLPQPKPIGPADGATMTKGVLAIKKPSEEKCSKVIARLMNPATKTQPTSKPKLLARLKNDLGKNAADSDVEDAVRKMEKLGLIIEPTGKLVYPSAK